MGKTVEIEIPDVLPDPAHARYVAARADEAVEGAKARVEKAKATLEYAKDALVEAKAQAADAHAAVAVADETADQYAAGDVRVVAIAEVASGTGEGLDV